MCHPCKIHAIGSLITCRDIQMRAQVQHKVEDVKDSADISIHSTSNKAERHAAHAKKNVSSCLPALALRALSYVCSFPWYAHACALAFP